MVQRPGRNNLEKLCGFLYTFVNRKAFSVTLCVIYFAEF